MANPRLALQRRAMAGNAMACATVLHWQGKKSAAAGLIRRI
jgi:hypothetical protein